MAEAQAAPRATARSWSLAVPVAALRQRQRGAFARLAELLALTAFALAQPVLDVTGRSPDFFLYRHPSVADVRLFVALVVLAPPLALWGFELAAGLVSERLAAGMHDTFLAGLFLAVAVEVGKHLHVATGPVLLVVSAVAAAALAVLAVQAAWLRQAIRYAVPAPLVFALLFAFASPAGALVRGARTHPATTVTAAHPAPIVFLFLDEFPERTLLDAHGRIDANLFPNFARLAAASTWYPNATGVSGWTPFAAPAMLSGRYPRQAIAPSYLAYPQNLFTWLAGSYDLHVFETISQLCPPATCPDVDAEDRSTGLDAMLRDTAGVTRDLVSPSRSTADVTQRYAERATVDTPPVTDPSRLPDPQFRFARTALNQPTRFTKFVTGLVPHARPTLHFLHLLLPHTPWQYLPSTARYDPAPADFVPAAPGEPTDGYVLRDPVLSVLAKQQLLLQTVYADHLLGLLLDRMQSTGLFDDALLVVTADHGRGLEPGAHTRVMDGKNPADLDWVPLFVKAPGQHRGRVDERNEQHVDLMPTIADSIGATLPWHVDGRSLLGPARPTDGKLWYSDPGHAERVDTARWRPLVRHGLGPEVARQDSTGTDGLFAVGPLRGLVDRPASSLSPGAAATAHATLDRDVDVAHVEPRTGRVPAMLYGTFDAPVAARSTWVVAAVNGTIAGTIPAVRDGNGGWRFLGLVNDRYFVPGANDVRLYTVSGSTLHEIAWS